MGAQLVKEVSTKTTTWPVTAPLTATLLAQAIVKEGLKNPLPGAKPPWSAKKGTPALPPPPSRP